MSSLINQALKAALLLALAAADLQIRRLHQAQPQAANLARQQALQSAALERQYREQEQRYREQINQIDCQAQQDLAAAHAMPAIALTLLASACSSSLPTTLATTAATAAGQCPSDPTPALDLFAELFRRTDERAGELAAAADEARVRGRACEGAYAYQF